MLQYLLLGWHLGADNWEDSCEGVQRWNLLLPIITSFFVPLAKRAPSQESFLMSTSLISSSSTASMTSQQIATLVEARHDNVKRTIERLAEQRVIEFPPTEEIPTATKPTSVYTFTGERGKRDSIVVVARLSPQFTASLVDRWQELEQQALPVTPSHEPRIANLEAAVERLIALQEATFRQAAPRQRALPKPKQEFLDTEELAVRLGLMIGGDIPDAYAVEAKLMTLGYQRTALGKYFPTETAEGFYKRGRGKNARVLWDASFVRGLFR